MQCTVRMNTNITTDFVIIGAGLTGLSLANKLQEQGKDFLVVEGRDRIGGRIHTIKTNNGDGANVECGATWYFPHFKNLWESLKEMNVKLKTQFMTGYTLYESSEREEPRKMYTREDSDMFRIEGGTSQIVESLYNRIESSKVLLSQRVTRVVRTESGVDVFSEGTVFHCKYVVSTLPPQLLAHSVQFEPALPSRLSNVMSRTHTWMGDSVKAIVTYDTPWWKEKNLSGGLYSNSGPFMQMYDQSDDNGAALVGFLKDNTAGLSQEERRKAVISQLVRVFGPEAGQYREYHDTAWKNEELTMPAGAQRLPGHSNVGHQAYQETYMDGRLYLGGTETSTRAGGFMEGSVNSANTIAKKIKNL